MAGARVTKGALYHHFSGKQALFEAVFERVETDASKSINKALRGKKDPWEKAAAGLAAFLEIVREPRYRRIVIQEGPAVLGYERFREQEERSTFGSVVDIVRSVIGAGEWDLDEGMLQTFARIFFGAMSSAGESVATAEDPELAAWRVEAAIGFMITGFQTLADSGYDLPSRHPLSPADDDDEPLARLLLGEGDVATVDRDQLDPRVAGRNGQLAGLGRQGHRRAEVVLAPRAADEPAAVEDHRRAGALELGLGHRVAGRVGVAGVADLHAEHQDRVGRELAGRVGVAVVVDVAAAVEAPRRRCARRRRSRSRSTAGWPAGRSAASPHGR